MTDNPNEVTVDNSVLILIDHQPWVAFGVNSIDPSRLSNNLEGLASTAKALDVPVILTTVGAEGGKLGLLPELDRRGGRRHKPRSKQMEKPIDLVSRFCAAWANNLGAEDLAAFFTDDAVYHNIPFEPVTGRENIADNIASFIRPGPPGIERIEFRVINIAANGPVVLTERLDRFTLAGQTFDLRVMGAFEVNEGKINAWRDYFDPSQFTSQIP